MLWPFNFLHASHVWHFGESSVTSHSWVLVAKILLIAHTFEFFTLSHTQPFHDSHLNTRYLIAELQANLARNKSNTWLNKFNLTIKCGFHDIRALFYIVVYSLHARCLIKCLLGIFSLIWALMSTKLWGFSYFLIRNKFGSLIMYLTHLALHVYFPCFGHALHIANSCTHLCYPCHALIYTLFFILACHVYFILCSILFYLLFEFHFLIHLAPLMYHYLYSYLHLLPLFLLDPLSIRVKNGESIL